MDRPWNRPTRRVSAEALALACLLAPAAAPDPNDGGALSSPVVAIVSPGSAAERAGIAPGDALVGWSREASGPLPLTSPFDLRRVEEEEAPRGEIELSGLRDGRPHRWRMPSAPWGMEARPGLPPGLWERCEAGLAVLEGEPSGEAGDWLAVVAVVERSGGHLAAAWLLAQAADRRIGAGDRAAGDVTYEEAIAAAARAGPPASTTAIVRLYDDWALALERAGDREAARARLEQGLEASSDGSLSRAHLQSRLGGMARRAGDLERARSALEEALSIREALAPRSLLAAASLYDLLLLARSRGDLTAAEEAGRLALAIQEADDAGSLATAKTRGALGQIALMRGDFEVAGGLFRASYETLRQLAPGSRHHGAAATNLGILARRSGDVETAMTRFHEALSILEALDPGSGAVAMLNNNLGVVAYDFGDLATAEKHLTRALELHELRAPGSLEVALYLDNLAGIAQERGRLARAEALYRRAQAIRVDKAPGSLDVATTLGNLGDLLHQRGDLGRAKVYYERALEIEREQAPGSLQEAATLSDLGILAGRQGDLQAAERLHRQSLAMRERLAPGSLDVASALSALASVTARRGQPEAAQAFAERALAIRQGRSPASLPTAASLYQLGRLSTQRGDAEAAVVHHRRALELRRDLAPGSHWVASSWNGLGEALRASGDPRGAREALCRATEVLDRDTSRVSELEAGRASFRAAFSDHYRDCIGALVEAGEPEAAFAAIERFRARWLLAMLAERDILFEADLPPELGRRMRRNRIEYDRLVAEIARLDVPEGSEAIEGHRRRMVDLREQREEIEKEVRRLSPRLARLQYPEPLGLKEARAALPAATVLLSYSVGAESTVLFALRREEGIPAGRAGFRTFVLPTTRRDLAAEVRSLREAIKERGRLDPIREAGSRLYDLLIRPAEPLLWAEDALLISPDGPLHTLPFTALVRREGETGSFLIESRPLHLVASATVYAQLDRSLPARPPDGPVLIAFGDPSYGAAGAGPAPGERSMTGRAMDLLPLPHARNEVESIAQLFDGRAELFLAGQATETRAKSISGRVDYVHFACHGFLDEQFPLDSSLAMTLPEGEARGDENGFLQAWEIVEQVRLEASLVTLSACETALGGDLGGEGLIGLVHAFQHAGARSVVASLWNIADRPTADLMRGFYSSLKDGMSKSKALQAAQLAFVRGEQGPGAGKGGERGVRRLVGDATGATTHPYYWAAFQLYGGG